MCWKKKVITKAEIYGFMEFLLEENITVHLFLDFNVYEKHQKSIFSLCPLLVLDPDMWLLFRACWVSVKTSE